MDFFHASLSSLVPRQPLSRLLDAGLLKRLTLVVAPAGYGKTTLLYQWLKDVPAQLPHVFYSIQEDDNDPAHLLAGLRAAMQACLPAGNELPEVDETQETLVFPLSVIFRSAAQITRSNWLLILDDYHAIQNPAIHQALDRLVNKPDWPVHLVLSSRVTPTLTAVARLRVEGQLVEMDENNLRFSLQDTLNLLKTEGLSAEDPQVARLAEHTEGWPAALRLVCQAAKRESGIRLDDLLDRMGGEGAMFDYLAGQVLASQPPAVGRFLRRTALLPYLSAEVCNAYLRCTNASTILADLRRRHLFLTPLNDQKETRFRYHSLFASFLRRCLEQEEGARAVGAWQRRAAKYFIECPAENLAERIAHHQYAIQLWLDAREMAAAADEIEVLAELLDWGQLSSLEKWFGHLPASEIQKRPRLLLALGWLQEKKCLWSEALAALNQASQLLSAGPGDQRLLVRVWIRQAWVYHRQGQYGRATELCQKAQAALAAVAFEPEGTLSPAWLRESAELYLMMATNAYEIGHMEEALQADALAIQYFRECGERIGEMRALSHQAYVYGNRGLLAEYIETEQTVLQIFTEMGSFRATACLIGLADAYRLLGDYELSWLMLERSFRMVDANPDPLRRGYALFLLGHWQRERGERAAARSNYEEARAIGDKLHESTLMIEPRRGLALLALDEGDGREALRLAETTLQRALAAGYQALVGLAWISLGLIQEQLGSRDLAEASFLTALTIYLTLGDTYTQTNIHLYLASLYLHGGREAEAFAPFSRSIELSNQFGYAAIFTVRERSRTLELLIAGLPAAAQNGALAEWSRLLLGLGEEAVLPLLGLLEQPASSLPLRLCLIELLGKIGDVRAISPLDRLSRELTGDHLVLKTACLSALQQIAQHPAPTLRVSTFGGFQVWVGSQLIAPAAWQQRRKTKLLFLYLLARRPRLVARDELLDALWPDLPPASAVQALNTTYSDLRKLLEPYLGKGMPSRYLAREGECYGFLAESPIGYDVEIFEQSLLSGELSLHAVQSLYLGDFLPEEPYLDWIVRERERLHGLYMNRLMEMLEIQVRQGAWHEGANLARSILAQEPWLEEVWRAEMTCLAMLGRRAEAIQVFLTGERNLRQELGVEPSAETRAFYQQLIR